MLSENNSTYDALKGRVIDEGYMFFDSGNYNINIIGERSKKRVIGEFTDYIYLAFRVCNVPVALKFRACTDPVLYKQSITEGNFLLPVGQYIGLWKVGFYNNYRALIQKRAVNVFTDKTRTSMEEIKTPNNISQFGINMHRDSSTTKKSVEYKCSAGCQVIKNFYDFEIIMSFLTRSIQMYGNSFSYTLLESLD